MCTVESRLRWNDSHAIIKKGASYHYRADGWWYDWWIGCGARGYHRCWLSPLNRLKRYPDGDWFQLIASVDRRRDQSFPLLEAGTFVAPASGRLWLYANDVPFMLWNNHGQLNFSLHPSAD